MRYFTQIEEKTRGRRGKRDDAKAPVSPIFPSRHSPLAERERVLIFQEYRRGMKPADLAKKYHCSTTSVYRVIHRFRVEHIMGLPLDFIESPEFRPNLNAEAERQLLASLSTPTHPAERTPGRPASANEDPFERADSFLLQLGCRPLLSAEGERHLFRKFNYLKYKASRRRAEMERDGASRALLTEIESLWHAAVAVKNEIVAANLRLVISIAKKHLGPNLSFSELLSDGNFSLMKAVDKFDYRRGNKFSTYASWAIWRNYARTIPDERRHQDRFRPSEVEVFEARMDDRGTLSQDLRVHSERMTQIDRLMEELDDREKSIIQRRFGLGRHDRPQTLRQVGHEIGVTKERVRQIETRAIEKLRKVAEAEHFEIPEPF